MRRLWGNVAILAAIVAIVLVSLVVGADRGPDGQEPFAGTDSIATQHVADSGHEPWFTPIFAPGSAEVESGLFALQAALGAGVLGYCLGRLHDRHRRRSGSGGPQGPDGSDVPGMAVDSVESGSPGRADAGAARPHHR